MLLQTNSYIVPKEKRAEHTRLVRRFRHTLARLGCEHFEVYEQVGANWTGGDSGGRFVQIIRFRDRQHQIAVQAAERSDPDAQALIAEFCDLINLPYQQQQGLFAMGYYHSVLPVTAPRVRVQDDLSLDDAITAEAGEVVVSPSDDLQPKEEALSEEAYGEELTEEPGIDETATEQEKIEEPAAETEPDLGLEWTQVPPHAPDFAPAAELHEAADLGELELEPQAAPIEEEIAAPATLAAEEPIGDNEVEDALDEALGHEEPAEPHAAELHELENPGLTLEAPDELEAAGEESASAEDELAEAFAEEELPAEEAVTEDEKLLSETESSGEEALSEEETLAEEELAGAEAEVEGEEEAVAEDEHAGEEEWTDEAETLGEEETIAEEEALAEEEVLGEDEALGEEEALAGEETVPEEEMQADEEEESEDEALSEEEHLEEEAVGEEPSEVEAVEEGLEEEVAEEAEAEPEALDLDADGGLHDDHLADTAGLDMSRQPFVDLLSETAVEGAPAMGGNGSHDPAPAAHGANGHGAASLHEGQNGDADFFSDAEIDDALNEALKELDEFDGSSVAAKPH